MITQDDKDLIKKLTKKYLLKGEKDKFYTIQKKINFSDEELESLNKILDKFRDEKGENKL